MTPDEERAVERMLAQARASRRVMWLAAIALFLNAMGIVFVIGMLR